MKRFAALAVTTLALACAFALAHADDYPSRPIRLIVGAPPGGTTDTMARSIAERMERTVMQCVVVENKPGAGGQIDAVMSAQSAFDGYAHGRSSTVYGKSVVHIYRHP